MFSEWTRGKVDRLGLDHGSACTRSTCVSTTSASRPTPGITRGAVPPLTRPGHGRARTTSGWSRRSRGFAPLGGGFGSCSPGSATTPPACGRGCRLRRRANRILVWLLPAAPPRSSSPRSTRDSGYPRSRRSPAAVRCGVVRRGLCSVGPRRRSGDPREPGGDRGGRDRGTGPRKRADRARSGPRGPLAVGRRRRAPTTRSMRSRFRLEPLTVHLDEEAGRAARSSTSGFQPSTWTGLRRRHPTRSWSSAAPR